MEKLFLQQFYCPVIILYVHKEFKIMKHANLQNGKLKYSKFPAKLVDKIPWNKIYVDIIGP